MSRLVKLLKNKIATCALIGTLLGGATPTIIQSYKMPDNASITTPLTLDDINSCGLKTKIININSLNNDNYITKEKQQKEYIDIRDIENYIYKNKVELVIFSPWNFDEKSKISRINYHYINKNDNLTFDEIEKIISLFKQGKIEEIIKNHNIDLQYSYKEYANNNEFNDIYNYSSELIVKTIDYNDVKVIKQDKEENIVETSIAGVTALIGLRLGIYTGNICENSSKAIKNRIKEKKLNRK